MRLIAEQIDGKPVQSRLVSAILMGTTMPVAKGKDVGGAFKSIPLCRAADQTGCVITFATFRSTIPPPANTLFGQVTTEGQEAACTNPAALAGGSGQLHAYLTGQGSLIASGAAQKHQWVKDGRPIETPFVSVPGLLSRQVRVERTRQLPRDHRQRRSGRSACRRHSRRPRHRQQARRQLGPASRRRQPDDGQPPRHRRQTIEGVSGEEEVNGSPSGLPLRPQGCPGLQRGGFVIRRSSWLRSSRRVRPRSRRKRPRQRTTTASRNHGCAARAAQDACAVDLTATVISEDGRLTQEKFAPNPKAPIDCFYVYPTVSLDPGGNSDMTPGNEERNVIRAQFARFTSQCRPFAPLYRQVTLTALRAATAGKPIAADRALGYNDVLDAWNHYLKNDNNGRGVVLIGHSQGSGVLSQLIRNEIDGKPIQSRIISALLLGSNVAVPKGKDVGGTFKNMPLCRSSNQTGCIVTYVSFRSTIPPPPIHASARRAERRHGSRVHESRRAWRRPWATARVPDAPARISG